MVKITIDKAACIGCGACAAICPSGFTIKDGKAVSKKASVPKVTCEKDAADSCPVAAIKIQ